ncbi:hypothetical protein BJV78DRAFT_1169382 [Lactifluus subvellereus]|nr:hypothetical protein BJV78DRAFT_1169382 [Lactifluus subvellereus]
MFLAPAMPEKCPKYFDQFADVGRHWPLVPGIAARLALWRYHPQHLQQRLKASREKKNFRISYLKCALVIVS